MTILAEAVSSEATIATAAQAGDRNAFADLYRHHHGAVFGFVFRRVGQLQIAEDITAETFTRGLRGIHRFQWDGTSVRAWFLTIARNLIADHYKAKRWQLEVTTADVLTAGLDQPDHSTAADPEAAALAAICSRNLIAAMASLTPEQRQCLLLRFYADHNVAETAAAMNLTDGAVKALQYRATQSLRRALPAKWLAAYRIRPTKEGAA